MLLDKGAIEVLKELLNSQHLQVIEQAIWALGNIAGDHHKTRDMVISHGVVGPIANILD